MLAIVIMINNYLHDLAAALLVASAVLMVIILKVAVRYESGQKNVELVVAIYQKVTRIALFSLGWIILGGIPRTIFFKRYEWWDAAGKGIVPVLLVKHALMFSLVGLGLILWLKVKKEISRITTSTKKQ